MQVTVQKKIDRFLGNAAEKARFLEGLRKITLADLLWPQRAPASYDQEWVVRSGRSSSVFPFQNREFHLQCVAERIQGMIAASPSDRDSGIDHSYTHPALAYYYLTLFQSEFRPGKGRKDSRLEKEKKQNFNKIQKLKRSLKVTPRVSRARDDRELLDRVLEVFDDSAREHRADLSLLGALEAEVAGYRNPEFLHPDQKKRLEEFVINNAELELAMKRERARNEILEHEVDRLAEQIISTPSVPEEVYDKETETLRREYAVLSQKCDALVSKNIELSNQVQKFNSVKTLGQILDIIRDKINGVLRAGVHEKDDILLKRIRNEIEQLQRARTYLGRALFDVGLLYLRTGEKDKARTEFRAARELGVEDPEIDQIINRS